MGTRGEQNASVAITGKIGLDQGKVIGVIKDQEPALWASLQPLFDRVHQLLLIGFVGGNKRRQQRCQRR